MPYKGDGKQFSIRLPREYIQIIEEDARRQHHNSKNAIIVQYLEKAIGQDRLQEVRERMEGEYTTETGVDDKPIAN